MYRDYEKHVAKGKSENVIARETKQSHSEQCLEIAKSSLGSSSQRHNHTFAFSRFTFHYVNKNLKIDF